MSKRAILITFISAAVLVVLVGGLSYWMYMNRPSADVANPPVPAAPQRAAKEYPPVPKEPILAGDAIDVGIVDVLDVNGLIIHWKEADKSLAEQYNLIDESGETDVINSADMNQVFQYWKCFEGRTDKNCPYKPTAK